MEEQSIIYNLEKTLEYSKKGNFETTASVELAAPSFLVIGESVQLAQMFTRAAMQAQKLAGDRPAEPKTESQGEMALDGAAVKAILYASDVDIMKLIGAFMALAEKVGTLDDEKAVRLKKSHFEKMTPGDVLGMACEYIANFTIPSM